MITTGSFFKARDLAKSEKRESMLPTLTVGNIIVVAPFENDEPIQYREVLCNLYKDKKTLDKEFNDTFINEKGVAKTANGFLFQKQPNFDIHCLTAYFGKVYEVKSDEVYSHTNEKTGVTTNNLHKYELEEIKF